MKPAQAQSSSPDGSWSWPRDGGDLDLARRYGATSNTVAKFGRPAADRGPVTYVSPRGASSGAQKQETADLLAGDYQMQTTGEMCVSPVGPVAMPSSPQPMLLSTMMATWS